MKRKGLSIIIALVLTLVFVLGSVSPVSAAPPQRVFMDITDLSVGSLSYDFWWEKKGASYYQITFYKGSSPIPDNMIYFGPIVDLEGRTPSYSVTQTWVNGQVVAGDRYWVSIRLFAKNMRVIKNSSVNDSELLS